MDTLYPIIRRARRPLIVHDAPPVVAGNVEPVKVDAAVTDVQLPATSPEATPPSVESSDADTPS
jgi:hypothetical protein